MPDSLAVFYCFPRSGGTLLNQCLLCAPDTVVLSEVNPAGCARDPVQQAAEWFGLLTPAEAADATYLTYLEKIALIHARTRAAGRRLCLRDWPGLNFLPDITPWTGRPSERLEQALYLQHAGYTLREVVLVRRSAAVYDSLRTHVPELATLSPEAFAAAYRAFLAAVAGRPTYRLEDLATHQARTLAALCADLDLAFAPDFADHFHAMRHVTGNTTLPAPPASAAWTSIRPPRPVTPPAAAAPGLFASLDRLAGYPDAA